jgi:hypothetical protein
MNDKRDAPGYFSKEYLRRIDPNNPSWIALRSLCFVLTWGRDALNPTLPAQQLDHLHYATLGHEKPLVDVIPLSIATHRYVTRMRDEGHRAQINRSLKDAGMMWLTLDAILAIVALGLLIRIAIWAS